MFYGISNRYSVTSNEHFNSKRQMEQLDAVDLALLDQLQQDASLTNQDLAARVHVSPPTCLRRVARLRKAGLIERQVAILDRDRLADVVGPGLQAVVEITLDRQDNEAMQAFEDRVGVVPEVQQCYRVSPGPGFMLVVQADGL